jgi:hypothetical protein
MPAALGPGVDQMIREIGQVGAEVIYAWNSDRHPY